jgi:group I intron endonuclease
MASISQTPSIYQIRHIESGRVYVGSAINPRDRLTAHKYELRKGTHHSQYLQHAWNKYGAAAFAFEIIEPVLLIEDLIIREQYWMNTLRAADRQYGFNICPTAGSMLGIKITQKKREYFSTLRKAEGADPVLRAKRSELAKAMWKDPAYRAKRTAQSRVTSGSPEARAALSERSKARFQIDPEARAKQSAISKAMWADPEWKARQVAARSTPEYRAMLSARRKARAARKADDPKVK